MNISKKLLLIVTLTCLEVSITVFAAFEIAKGARFHQLNFLHLKYINQLANRVEHINLNNHIDIDTLEADILAIREQPQTCIDEANALNLVIMKIINTSHAILLCKQDVELANKALYSLEQYRNGVLSREQILQYLVAALQQFNKNSEAFEAPITKTVSFIFISFIPLVIIISLFNIASITYLSRTISSSIRDLTSLLLSQSHSHKSLDYEFDTNTPDELKSLIFAAKKRIENDLLNLESSQHLQAIVKTQTASLQQANDELAQFAYRASHDLKSPLTGAKSLAKFVIEDIKNADTQEALKNTQTIVNQMEKLELLVTDILKLAKADIATKEREVINFDEIIGDIKTRLYWLIKQNNCDFNTFVDVPVSIKMDKTRFTQIIENLISNALKYHDSTKSFSFVKCDIFIDKNDFTIIIEDNGIGISKKFHNEVFEMFKRFHPHLSEGSGLGLALVKKHVEFLKGTINFVSSSHGSTFKITLPLRTLI